MSRRFGRVYFCAKWGKRYLPSLPLMAKNCIRTFTPQQSLSYQKHEYACRQCSLKEISCQHRLAFYRPRCGALPLLITKSEITLNMPLRHIISLGLLFASLIESGGAWAVDCPLGFYALSTQGQVETFCQDCDSPRLSNCAGFIS